MDLRVVKYAEMSVQNYDFELQRAIVKQEYVGPDFGAHTKPEGTAGYPWDDMAPASAAGAGTA